MQHECRICHKLKKLEEFRSYIEQGKYRDGRLRYKKICSICATAQNKQWVEKKKAELGERKYLDNQNKQRTDTATKRMLWKFEYLKTHPCVDCGELDPIVLEFDHIRGQKLFNVCSGINSRMKWERVLDEIAKCAVRCCNCHQRKTAKEQGWHSYLKD